MSDRREQLIRMIIVYGNTHRDFATEAADAIIAAGWTIGHPYQTACGGEVPYTIITTINDSAVLWRKRHLAKRSLVVISFRATLAGVGKR